MSTSHARSQSQCAPGHASVLVVARFPTPLASMRFVMASSILSYDSHATKVAQLQCQQAMQEAKANVHLVTRQCSSSLVFQLHSPPCVSSWLLQSCRMIPMLLRLLSYNVNKPCKKPKPMCTWSRVSARRRSFSNSTRLHAFRHGFFNLVV